MNGLRISLFAIVVGVAGIGGVFVLMPDQHEMGAVYLRTARYGDAVNIYQRRFNNGERSAEVTSGLAWLYQANAQVDRAITLYEAYARRHPGSREARRRLEWLYRETQRSWDHARALARRIAGHANPAERRQLAALYWRQGRYPAWSGQMVRLAKNGHITATEAFAHARFLAARGKTGRALAILQRHVLAGQRGVLSAALAHHAVLLAVSLHLDRRENRQALALAKSRGKGRRAAALRLRLVDLFEARGHGAQAAALLEPAAGNNGYATPALRRLTWLDYRNGKHRQAFDRLDRLATQGRLRARDYDLLLVTAVAAKRLSRAWAALTRVDVGRIPEAALAGFAGAALGWGDAKKVSRLLARMKPGFSRRHPVIGARLALIKGQRALARKLVLAALSSGPISTSFGVDMARQLLRAGDKRTARQVVRRLLRQPLPGSESVIAIAGLAWRMGLSVDAQKWLNGARAPKGGTLWQRAARLVLKPGVTAKEIANALRAAPSRDSRLVLLRLLRAEASRAGHAALAQAVLTRLAVLTPRAGARLLIRYAYEHQSQPKRVLAALRKHLGTSARVDQQYAIALVRAARAGHHMGANLKGFLSGWLGRQDVPLKTRRIIVDDLIAIGKAKMVAAALAPSAAKAGQDVREIYTVALMHAGEREKAAEVAAWLVSGARKAPLLYRYALLAEQAGDLKAAMAGYRRLLKDSPGNLKVMKRLAVVAFWAEEEALSRRLLTAYVAKRPGDWEALHLLGEVINKFPDWRQAAPVYRRGLARIAELPRPSIAARSTRAHILYRLGRFDASIREFRKLLRQHPRDKETRERFIDVLLALGRYRESDDVRKGRPPAPRLRKLGEASQ